MQRKLSSMLVLAAAVALPTAVLAADADSPSRPPSASGAPRDAGMTFNSLDTNKDGYVTREEAKNSATLSKQFSQLDKDGDGKLSAAELAASSPSAPSTPRSGE
ncbi:MAG TPA: EF-hand domain-containing protein [Burkholderiales bacterium]|jgi:hypothetical protein|nr:EF-hand domain-containing protein [Burkholderiales bacterium]